MNAIELLEFLDTHRGIYWILLILLGSLGFILYKFMNRRYSLSSSTYEEIVNERSKEYMKNITNRLSELEKDQSILLKQLMSVKEELYETKEENNKLIMINGVLLSNKTLLKDIPYWFFSYPDNKAVFVSSEYERLFLHDKTANEYIRETNNFVWDDKTSNIYNENNKKAAENNVWIGYEPIVVNGKDLTNKYVVIKIAIKNNIGVVIMVMGMAIDIRSDYSEQFIDTFIEQYNINKTKKDE